MSNSNKEQRKARVQRGPGPKQKLRPHNYRERALPFLRTDFEGRCAYSMQHESRPGLTSMEVDHFNPTLPTHSRNKYTNLFFSLGTATMRNGGTGRQLPKCARIS